MKSAFKFLAIIVTAALIFSACDNCYCDDSSQDIKTFRGQVMEMDWVKNLVTCRGIDEVTFYVPPGTTIRDGTGTISLSELEEDDNVLIKYVDNPTGTPKVVSMSVDKSYPEF